MNLRNERLVEVEKGRARSHGVKNWICKWLWACRKADIGLMALYCTVLYCTALYCTVLYCTTSDVADEL